MGHGKKNANRGAMIIRLANRIVDFGKRLDGFNADLREYRRLDTERRDQDEDSRATLERRLLEEISHLQNNEIQLALELAHVGRPTWKKVRDAFRRLFHLEVTDPPAVALWISSFVEPGAEAAKIYATSEERRLKMNVNGTPIGSETETADVDQADAEPIEVQPLDPAPADIEMKKQHDMNTEEIRKYFGVDKAKEDSDVSTVAVIEVDADPDNLDPTLGKPVPVYLDEAHDHAAELEQHIAEIEAMQREREKVVAEISELLAADEAVTGSPATVQQLDDLGNRLEALTDTIDAQKFEAVGFH